jgi:hypothetical protein
MMINWQEVITSLGGNAVLLAAVAWLIKSLVSNRLAREAEQFKADLKTRADIEIERLRVSLTRASRVHEQQVDTLTALYGHLRDAQGHLQQMTRSGRVEGELSEDEYHQLWATAVMSASETLSKGELLIPRDIVQECTRFFDAVSQGRRDIALSKEALVHPRQRGEFWRKAQQIAGEQVPKILDDIQMVARKVIHGDPRYEARPEPSVPAGD